MSARDGADDAWRREVDGVLLEGGQNLVRSNVLQDEVVGLLTILAPLEHNYERAVGMILVWLRYSPDSQPPAATAALLNLGDELDGETFEEQLRRYVL